MSTNSVFGAGHEIVESNNRPSGAPTYGLPALTAGVVINGLGSTQTGFLTYEYDDHAGRRLDVADNGTVITNAYFLRNGSPRWGVRVFVNTAGSASAPTYSYNPTIDTSISSVLQDGRTGDVAITATADRLAFAYQQAVQISTGSVFTYTTEATLADPATTASHNFGCSLSFAKTLGDRIAVGAYGHTANSGVVYVYSRSGTSWSLEATIASPVSGAKFGTDVALSADGSRLLVGAPDANGSGAVYVYGRSGTTWSLLATPGVSGGGAGHALGASVSLSADGSVATAGAPGASGGRVYIWMDTNWSGGTYFSGTSGNLGIAVAASNTTIIAGDTTLNDVSIYDYVGGTWRYAVADTTGAAASNFGASVAVVTSGLVVYWGNPDSVVLGSVSGRVLVRPVTPATVTSAVPTGQVIFETDTRNFKWYTGSGWSGLVPAGTIAPHSHADPPTGWLHCRGQTVSRTDYPDLFGAIGTQYNTGGESSTEFRLPDLRGRRPAGVDNLGGVAAGRLSFTGATNPGTALGHKNYPSHHHSYTASGTSGDDSPDHGHQWPLAYYQGGQGAGDIPARSMYGWDGNFRTGWRAVGGYNASDRPHQHTISWSGDTNQALDSNESVNTNLPPFMMLAYVIKF